MVLRTECLLRFVALQPIQQHQTIRIQIQTCLRCAALVNLCVRMLHKFGYTIYLLHAYANLVY